MNPLLPNFSPELSREVLQIGLRRTFAANEHVFEVGDAASFLPIILEGKVKMVRFPEAGKEIILGVFEAGSVFAIPPAMDGKRFPASAIAVERSRLLLLPREEFLSLMNRSTEFSTLIMARMCGLLRDRTETAQILATPSAENRVASVLLRLAGDINGNGEKKITQRRQDIAEMSGLSLETTIRSIRKLSERGCLKIVRGKVILETTEHLRDLLR
jgi:CRP/FNR family transcriptional regulator, cyclic AMP receptor protein